MSLVLSSEDRAHLARALSVISAPLDASSEEEWRHAVLASLAPLFQAQAGSFVIANGTTSGVTLFNRPQAYVEDYASVQHLDTAPEAWDSAVTVGSTESLSRGNRSVYTDSVIYHEFYHPYAIEETVFTAFGAAETPPFIAPGVPFLTGNRVVNGMLCLYAEKAGRPRIRSEGVALLTMIRPAIAAAVKTWIELGTRRLTLLNHVDTSAEAISIVSSRGSVVHRNPAYCALLGDESAVRAVEAASARLASGLLIERKSEIVDLLGTQLESVVVGARSYRLRATRVSGLLPPHDAVVITVEPLDAPLQDGEICRHLGLTPRECEVARLLALGTTNKRISIALRISEFTVRRHTERVFRKLGVNSRAQVAARLLQPDGPDPER